MVKCLVVFEGGGCLRGGGASPGSVVNGTKVTTTISNFWKLYKNTKAWGWQEDLQVVGMDENLVPN